VTSTYLSCFDYARSPSGLEYGSLVANMTRIGGTGVSVGATTLTIIPPGLTNTLNLYDRITIFDGASSEVVSVTVSTDTTGVETIQCTPTQFAHVVGTPICSDGILGSLADSIVSASQWLETICKQSLFLSTYNDLLAMPTMRGSIDNHHALHFRPRHWPIQSLSSLSITTVPNNTINYDPTQVVIDSDRQICSMPNMQPLPLAGSGQAPYPIWNTTSRYQAAQLAITYTAGYSTIPADVTEAAILLTSDILAKRLNPVGAPDIQSGDRHISAVLRGDTTGESLLYKRAAKILDYYSMESF
jgi:hypothetical protein